MSASAWVPASCPCSAREGACSVAGSGRWVPAGCQTGPRAKDTARMRGTQVSLSWGYAQLGEMSPSAGDELGTLQPTLLGLGSRKGALGLTAVTCPLTGAQEWPGGGRGPRSSGPPSPCLPQLPCASHMVPHSYPRPFPQQLSGPPLSLSQSPPLTGRRRPHTPSPSPQVPSRSVAPALRFVPAWR